MVGMVIILVFLNQSLMAGHSSAESIMNFPKNDIRDIRSVTLSEAQTLGNNANDKINATPYSYDNNKTAFDALFNSSFDKYIGQVQSIFADRGTVVDVTYQNNITQYPDGTYTTYLCDNTTINLYYNNGETSYEDITTLYFR